MNIIRAEGRLLQVREELDAWIEGGRDGKDQIQETFLE